MSFAKLSNFETFSLAGTLCRLVLRLSVTALLLAVATPTVYARCGLLSADQFVVQVERLTKLSADDLVLLPVQQFVYESGTLRTSFSQIPEPCQGPACRESRFPSQSLPLTTISSNSSTTVIGVVTHCYVFDDTMLCVDRVSSFDLEHISDRDRPALHPPSV